MITEFECEVDIKNHEFGFERVQNRVLLLINDDKKCKKNSSVT